MYSFKYSTTGKLTKNYSVLSLVILPRIRHLQTLYKDIARPLALGPATRSVVFVVFLILATTVPDN